MTRPVCVSNVRESHAIVCELFSWMNVGGRGRAYVSGVGWIGRESALPQRVKINNFGTNIIKANLITTKLIVSYFLLI